MTALAIPANGDAFYGAKSEGGNRVVVG